MRLVSTPSIVRLGVRPDEPEAEGVPAGGPRPRGSRRPHADAKVAAVRRLIEQTALTYSEIAAKTGVGRASICRWTRDGGWQRPAFAPRATDRIPTARASARLRRRTLSARLSALAERHIRELEESASIDPERLAEALELLKMARLAARPKKRRPGCVARVPAQAGILGPQAQDAPLSSPPAPAPAAPQRLNPYDEAVLRARGVLPGSRRPARRPPEKLSADVLEDLRAAGVDSPLCRPRRWPISSPAASARPRTTPRSARAAAAPAATARMRGCWSGRGNGG